MRKSILHSCASALFAAAVSTAGFAFAEGSDQAPSTAAKTAPATSAANSTAANSSASAATSSRAAAPVKSRATQRRGYRGSNRNDPSIAAWGRTSYNYTGIGFPRMEGGLTAAANRTTWLKPMYPPHRRGRW